MKTRIGIWALGLLLAGCGGAPDDAVASQLGSDEASIRSPLAGIWYSAGAVAQVCATVTVSADSFSMTIAPIDKPDEPLHVISGAIDPDGRHLANRVTVDGESRSCFGFATADGTRMFLGYRYLFVSPYLESWAFLRTR